jgi:DNA-3-methyladenine glycosylase
VNAARRLSRDFYARPTLAVAADLIAKVLVHHTPAGRSAGRIVEVEAYIGEDDPACHAAPGPTRRNEPLYGVAGVAYVYLNYGIHCLTNVVTDREGFPAAVLLRALAPLEGVDLMRRRRARSSGRSADSFALAELCRGPGNLSKALGITLRDNRRDLVRSRLTIEDWGLKGGALVWSPRIGIRVGADKPWRCYERGCDCVSGTVVRVVRAAAGSIAAARA